MANLVFSEIDSKGDIVALFEIKRDDDSAVLSMTKVFERNGKLCYKSFMLGKWSEGWKEALESQSWLQLFTIWENRESYRRVKRVTDLGETHGSGIRSYEWREQESEAIASWPDMVNTGSGLVPVTVSLLLV